MAGTHRDGHERAARFRDGRIVTLAKKRLVRNEGGGGVKRGERHVCVDGGGAMDTSRGVLGVREVRRVDFAVV